jgi:hypothetical protein
MTVPLIVGLLFFVLFVFSILAATMVAAEFDRESNNEMAVLDASWTPTHEEFADAVHSLKVSRIAGAMKADREAALKRIGGDA